MIQQILEVQHSEGSSRHFSMIQCGRLFDSYVVFIIYKASLQLPSTVLRQLDLHIRFLAPRTSARL